MDVKLQVQNLSFSAHADAKGIMQLIRMCEPRNVILVHGEKAKMYVSIGPEARRQYHERRLQMPAPSAMVLSSNPLILLTVLALLTGDS